MAALVYVGEAMSYRTTGLIDARLLRSGTAPGSSAHDRELIAAVEEHSIEASILKVWGSEALGLAADESLQIHGGYGFVEEYAIERVYRDNRVNRIFEGTNEINRMLIPGTLLKRAMKGQFPLLELARSVTQAVERFELPRAGAGPLARERRMAELAKHMFVLALQAAVETFGPALNDRQEVLGALADVATEAYALDSAVARALQSAARAGALDPVAEACVKLYALEGHERAYDRARRALRCTVTDTTACRARLSALARLLDDDPSDLVALRETVVGAALEAGRYPLTWA